MFSNLLKPQKHASRKRITKDKDKQKDKCQSLHLQYPLGPKKLSAPRASKNCTFYFSLLGDQKRSFDPASLYFFL